MIRYSVIFLLFVPLCITAQTLPDFSATYAVEVRGFQAGELHQHLTTNRDGSRQFSSTTQAKGIFAFFKPDLVEETSTWLNVDNTIQPQQYLYQRTKGKKDKYLKLDFNWQTRQLNIDDKHHPWQLALEPNTLDKSVYQLALMTDLGTDKTQFNYRIADGGKIKNYQINIIANEEMITTRLGKIKTVKLKRLRGKLSKRETILWCAPALNFLPVKLQHTEKDGTVFTATLRQLTGMPTANAFIPLTHPSKPSFIPH